MSNPAEDRNDYATAGTPELARLAIQGDDDARDELIRRDPELGRLYGAFYAAARADQDASLVRDDSIFGLMPEPGAEQDAAIEAYHARLRRLAEAD